MRSISLTLCILIFWCASAWAAPAHVQSTNGQAFSGTTVSATFASNLTAGNLIVVCLYADKGVSSKSDTLSHTYQTANEQTDGSTFVFGVYYVPNISAGADTLTVTLTGTTAFALLDIHEYSGVATSTPLDQNKYTNNVVPGTATDAISTGSVTTTTDGQLIFGCTGSNEANTATVTAGTGYTIRQNPLNDNPTEDKVQTSAGSVAATWTTTDTTASYSATIATFKAASAATPRLRTLLGVGQ